MLLCAPHELEVEGFTPRSLLGSRQSALLPMPVLKVQALGAREIYAATALSVFALLLCIRGTGVKLTRSPDPSTRQSTISKATSEDEGGSQQPAQSSAVDTPKNETCGRLAESRAQLHQGPSGASAVKPQPPVCFRIPMCRKRGAKVNCFRRFRAPMTDRKSVV